MSDAATIARLNDAWRRSGTFMTTAGVQALGADFVVRAIAAVRDFDDFTEDNDPYGEHDFGSLEIDGHTLFWKIDYYAKARQGRGESPTAMDQKTQPTRARPIVCSRSCWPKNIEDHS